MSERQADEEALAEARRRIDAINARILGLLSERGGVALEIKEIKERLGLGLYDPEREWRQLEVVAATNPGPFPDAALRSVFRRIFRVTLERMGLAEERPLLLSRARCAEDRTVRVGPVDFGPRPLIVAGPCAVESEEQLEQVAAACVRCGVGVLRGGAYKPRTSPYTFQGLGLEGLRVLRTVARRHGLAAVTEVTDTRNVAACAEHADMLQVGTRNMFNYELLKEVAAAGRPVLLKRGFMATLDELLHAAEYLAAAGNEEVVLCERGIRTHEHRTRNTLDISAVPLLRSMTPVPVMVDVSHAAGRTDLLLPLARASLAAGAQAIMVEVHPSPQTALSDPEQQLTIPEFEDFVAAVGML